MTKLPSYPVVPDRRRKSDKTEDWMLKCKDQMQMFGEEIKGIKVKTNDLEKSLADNTIRVASLELNMSMMSGRIETLRDENKACYEDVSDKITLAIETLVAQGTTVDRINSFHRDVTGFKKIWCDMENSVMFVVKRAGIFGAIVGATTISLDWTITHGKSLWVYFFK